MRTLEVLKKNMSPFSAGQDLYPTYVRQGASPKNYKAGFMDARGRTVIEPTFEDAQSFHEGLASVQMKQRWGAIDSSGTLVIPCLHSTRALAFRGGVSAYMKESRCGLIGVDGTIILPANKYWVISEFHNELAYVWDGTSYGFINRRGELLIPLFFEDVRDFVEGLAPARINGKWGYIDTSASFVIAPRFDAAMPFHEGIARVSLDNSWGYIDRNGDFLIGPRFAMAHDFRMGLAGVRSKPKGPCGFINKSGELIIPEAYSYVHMFHEGLAAVTLAGQRFECFINTKGDRAFSGEYLGAHDFQGGLCRVATLETTAYIDHDGKAVWEGSWVDRP
jgi:hypothetical protein